MLAVSWVAAVVACLGYGTASVLQSVGARRVARATGVTGVAAILLQVPYLVGLSLDAVAFVANVVALQRLPLFLVQTVMSASVGVTALIALLRGTRFGRTDWVFLGVLGVGLVAVSATANSESAVSISSSARWAVFATTAVPVLVGVVASRLAGSARWVTLGLASGLGFTGVAVASRGISAQSVGWGLLADPLVWTIVVQGAVGLVCFALALQTGPVTTITALTFVVEMVIPGVVGLWLFGDTVHAGLGWVAAIGFGLAIVGTVGLARFAT